MAREGSGGLLPEGESLRRALRWLDERAREEPNVDRAGAIGAAARRQMESLFGRKVFLKLWVKVREGWSDDEIALRKFGFET
jgi:GTP-binding protein Era